MRHLLFCLFFLIMLPHRIFPQVVINEFSSSNISLLEDEDKDYNDWIELYNNSSSAKNMLGYYLSDDPAIRKKWKFPAVTIDPFSYLVVFASGKNRTAIPETYTTIIPRYAVWQYLVPVSEPNSSWKNPGFDAAGWNTGASGFGYADNDDSTIIDKVSSVYVRKEFNLTGIHSITGIVLSIDYDDGFVAFINGHEIARSNVGTATNIPYNRFTITDREAVMYSGGFPENFIITNPSAFLVEGINVIAVQGYNNSTSSSDFSLIPMLSIARTTGISDSVPGYIKLGGKKLHTGFRIDQDGEPLILSAPDSSIADQVNPVLLTGNLSFGRKPDGTTMWRYFGQPTPGMPNTTTGYTSIIIDTVIFSVKGGYFSSWFDLSLTSTRQSDSIFYTTDGSEPTAGSLRFISPIRISGNMTVRAKSVKTGTMPGVVTSHTYFTKKHTFPVICISTDPTNLWDFYTGIYVMGPNASSTSPYFGANFWQDWEKRAHMELYDLDGVKQIDQDVGLKIFGAWSRAHDQKSFSLFARKEYGKGSLEYKFFRDKPIGKFESIVLRNGGNDWSRAIIRDGLTSILVSDMDLDRSAFQPAVIYLNGEYWGILNIREKISDNYLEDNHFVDTDNLNLLEANSKIVDGSNKSYTEIIDYLNANTLETDAKYKQVSSKIDLDNYIQYQLTQIYIDNKDWPGNNIKYWNTNDPGSLWRWIIYDTDFGFSIYDANAYTFNTLEYALVPNSTSGANRPWATLFFRRMMSNQGFRNEFANQYADRINRNFLSTRIRFVADSLMQLYIPEINQHLTRWNLKYDNWTKNLDNIAGFATYRPGQARSHMRSELNLGSTTEIKVEIVSPGTGLVRVNSIIPYSFPFTGTYFKDLPIQLTAIPSPGYKFARWEMGSLISNNLSLTYNMAGPQSFRAVFDVARNLDIKLVINEISYNSSPQRDTEDWIEIYNAGKSSVNLRDWKISDSGPENGFVFNSDIILTPGMYLVVCRDQAAFRSYNIGVKNTAGDLGFGLSSSGDEVHLYDPEGRLVDFVRYDVVSPWPLNVPEGGSIELSDPYSDNNNGINWKASATGTPGNINTGYAGENPVPEISETKFSSFPNPFRDYSTFQVQIAEQGRYRIDIYSMLGKLVKTMFDQEIEKGEYYFDWHGEDGSGAPLPAGVYTVILRGNNTSFASRIIFLK
jgi:hypothetical protein